MGIHNDSDYWTQYGMRRVGPQATVGSICHDGEARVRIRWKARGGAGRSSTFSSVCQGSAFRSTRGPARGSMVRQGSAFSSAPPTIQGSGVQEGGGDRRSHDRGSKHDTESDPEDPHDAGDVEINDAATTGTGRRRLRKKTRVEITTTRRRPNHNAEKNEHCEERRRVVHVAMPVVRRHA